MNRDLVGKQLSRTVILDCRQIDFENRMVPAALSSEEPVVRSFGQEVLIHTNKAINLTRAKEGLPLLFQHNQEQPIGLVENIRLADNRLRGTLRFSQNPKAEEVFRDVRDGFLKNLSIGYSIDRWEEEANSDRIRITGWTLLEASVVTVPADPSVGINRSITGVNPMTDEVKPAEAGTQDSTAPVVDIDTSKLKREHAIAKKAGAAEAIRAERARIAELDELFSLSVVATLSPDFVASLRTQAIDKGWSPSATQKALLESLSGESAPLHDYSLPGESFAQTHRAVSLPPPTNQHRALGRVEMGQDQVEKFRAGIEQGLMVRAGILTERAEIAKAREGGFVGKAMKVIAGDFLRACNVSTANLDDETTVTRAMSYRASGQTTSDFTNILANVANKSLLQGWDEAPETWQIWTRRGQLPDFKQAAIVGISGFTGLDEVPEDGDVSYGKFTDRKETIKLVQYAKKYRLSRIAVINDDLNAFTAVPRAMGRAAQRKIGDITYALLNGTGPTLNQDSTALFDTSTHKNYVAAATAPTVATLNTATTAMAKQTDPNSGAVLNIRPRYLLVPAALMATAKVLMAATYDPAGTAGTLPPNPFSGAFEVVTDARLDGQTNGATAWYLVADPNVFDTVEVAFLNGVAEPYMKENQAWDGLGVEYMVGVDFGVSALDFRGIHKYRGS